VLSGLRSLGALFALAYHMRQSYYDLAVVIRSCANHEIDQQQAREDKLTLAIGKELVLAVMAMNPATAVGPGWRSSWRRPGRSGWWPGARRTSRTPARPASRRRPVLRPPRPHPRRRRRPGRHRSLARSTRGHYATERTVCDLLTDDQAIQLGLPSPSNRNTVGDGSLVFAVGTTPRRP
jgi:hypothetical protein